VPAAASLGCGRRCPGQTSRALLATARTGRGCAKCKPRLSLRPFIAQVSGVVFNNYTSGLEVGQNVIVGPRTRCAISRLIVAQ
jgi:hypothetical protein